MFHRFVGFAFRRNTMNGPLEKATSHRIHRRIADCGLRTADCGLRIADCGLRIADCCSSASYVFDFSISAFQHFSF
jgi:hypothetical protein